jgi:8-oxo-dGTP pyrophosphatase MutT (NUDIX family)
MSFDAVVGKINSFDRQEFFALYLTFPDDGRKSAQGFIHPDIAGILAEAGHLAILREQRQAVLAYKKSDDNCLNTKLLHMQDSLIKAGLIQAHHRHTKEILPVYTAADIEKPFANCPRNAAHYFGLITRSVACILHDSGRIYLGTLNLNDPDRGPNKGILDIAAGTCGIGQSYEDALIEEVHEETGFDLKKHPVQRFVGHVHISRLDEKRSKNGGKPKYLASKHEIMAVYTADLSLARQQYGLPDGFELASQEVPPRTLAWASYSINDTLRLLEAQYLSSGKICATLLGMHALNLVSGPEMDLHVANIRNGKNGSVYLRNEAGVFISPERPAAQDMTASRATLTS